MSGIVTIFALILGPVLLGLFCFVGLPAMYFVLGKRMVERVGFDRAGNVFLGITVTVALAAWATPPTIVTRVATPLSEMAGALKQRLHGGESGVITLEKEIDWAQTMVMLVLEPPVLLWLAVLGGLGVLAALSRNSKEREI